MDRIKKFASDFKYELIVGGILLLKLISEFKMFLPLSFALVACQYLFVALLTARFIKNFSDNERRYAEGFAAMFLVFFMAAYHYSLFSPAKVDSVQSVTLVLFFAALYCMSIAGAALIAVPLAVAGVILDSSFAIICLPVMIAGAAFAGGGLFAKKSKMTSRQRKPKGRLAKLAAYDKYAAVLLLLLFIAAAVRYFVSYDEGLGMFYADPYYIDYNAKYLLYMIPFAAVIASLMFFARGSRRAVILLVAGLAATVFTFAMAYLFDFELINFRVYRMCAVSGVFGSIFALASRSENGSEEMRSAASGFIKKAYPVIIVVSLCAFCVGCKLMKL